MKAWKEILQGIGQVITTWSHQSVLESLKVEPHPLGISCLKKRCSMLHTALPVRFSFLRVEHEANQVSRANIHLQRNIFNNTKKIKEIQNVGTSAGKFIQYLQ